MENISKSLNKLRLISQFSILCFRDLYVNVKLWQMPAARERRKELRKKSEAWIYFYFITVIVAHWLPPFRLPGKIFGSKVVWLMKGGCVGDWLTDWWVVSIAVMWLLRKDTWTSLSLLAALSSICVPGVPPFFVICCLVRRRGNGWKSFVLLLRLAAFWQLVN